MKGIGNHRGTRRRLFYGTQDPPGGTTFGFATSGTHIAAGARLGGNDVGVIGHCDKVSGPEQVGVGKGFDEQ